MGSARNGERTALHLRGVRGLPRNPASYPPSRTITKLPYFPVEHAGKIVAEEVRQTVSDELTVAYHDASGMGFHIVGERAACSQPNLSERFCPRNALKPWPEPGCVCNAHSLRFAEMALHQGLVHADGQRDGPWRDVRRDLPGGFRRARKRGRDDLRLGCPLMASAPFVYRDRSSASIATSVVVERNIAAALNSVGEVPFGMSVANQKDGGMRGGGHCKIVARGWLAFAVIPYRIPAILSTASAASARVGGRASFSALLKGRRT